MTQQLIKLTQKPIIEFSAMESRGMEVKQQIKEMNIPKIEATEENRGSMKKIRAQLNKELKVFEDQRKMIHGKISEPYNQFKDSYEENIKVLYQDAEGQLKEKISEVESKMLSAKKAVIAAYFSDVNRHSFVALDEVGLKIILSASDKKLKSEIDKFLAGINADVESINSMDNSVRIMGYYERTLDLADSIATVNADIKREEELAAKKAAEEKAAEEKAEREEKERIEREQREAKERAERAEREAEEAKKRQEQAAKNAAVSKAKEAQQRKERAEVEAQLAKEKAEEAKAHTERLERENKERESAAAKAAEILTVAFKVSGTRLELKELKAFINNSDLEIIND